MWIDILVYKQPDVESGSYIQILKGKSRIICDIINRQLSIIKFKIQGVQKIAIAFEEEEGINFLSKPIKGYSPVICIRKTFDFGRFNDLDDSDRNEMILSSIESDFNRIAKEFDFDVNLINEIISEVKRLDFKQRYIVGQLKNSRGKKHKAGIEVEMLMEETIISCVFFSNEETLIKKIKLISTHSSRFFFGQLLGGTKWINNTDFELLDRKREIHFRASVLKETAELHFTPSNRDVNAVIDDLLILSSSTSKEQAMSILQGKIDNLDLPK